MINPIKFLKFLKKQDISFYTGVPDSLMKSFCSLVEKDKDHIPAVNEGSAIGLGIGYHLATNKIPLIYLQNSGLGNIVNPIVSLANNKVFKIPLFLLVGWRGETINNKANIDDEPQHSYQGYITEKLLKLLQIKYAVINQKSNFAKHIKKLLNFSKKNSAPVALLIRKNCFTKVREIKKTKNNFLNRKEIIKIILDCLPKKTSVISTTGVLSRELMDLNKIKETNNFYCVGGMGHAISIAKGVAIKMKRKKILCLDGDGAALMHLGAQANNIKLNNLIHILINNSVHDSVGGQKTAGENIKYHKLAAEAGYKKTFLCTNKRNIEKAIKDSLKLKQSTFLEILSSSGYKKDLIRPDKPMVVYKKKFMRNLKK